MLLWSFYFGFFKKKEWNEYKSRKFVTFVVEKRLWDRGNERKDCEKAPRLDWREKVERKQRAPKVNFIFNTLARGQWKIKRIYFGIFTILPLGISSSESLFAVQGIIKPSFWLSETKLFWKRRRQWWRWWWWSILIIVWLTHLSHRKLKISRNHPGSSLEIYKLPPVVGWICASRVCDMISTRSNRQIKTTRDVHSEMTRLPNRLNAMPIFINITVSKNKRQVLRSKYKQTQSQ